MSQPAGPSVSLIIVSRRRPALLARCLAAVALMDHPAFEVVVVADNAGLAAVAGLPVKVICFDESNISQARNLGISAAEGEVVAFIDDDAVPEPLWLWHLTRPFANPAVLAAGGFVLGWNGISLEWAGGTVSGSLECGPLEAVENGLSLCANRPGHAIEVKGVNCAYRREQLLAVGGFDPNLRYYLDETELNLRIAALRGLTAVVPEARVHHVKAESEQRRADRVPKSLYDVGFSTAYSLTRHVASDQVAEASARLRRVEEEKLRRFVMARRIDAAEAADLLLGFDQGHAAGLQVKPTLPEPLTRQSWPFLPFPSLARVVTTLAGRPWQLSALRRRADKARSAGDIVRIFVFSPTALFHHRRFVDGMWIQRGGLFGKSDRTDPLVRFWRFGRRLSRESARFMSGFRKT